MFVGSDVFYLWGEPNKQNEEGRVPGDVTTRNGLVRLEGEQYWSSVCQVGWWDDNMTHYYLPLTSPGCLETAPRCREPQDPDWEV